MITDGYWKNELVKTVSTLKHWRRIARWTGSQFAEHQINKQFLYSAVIIRKMIEDEKDALTALKSLTSHLPPFFIMNATVPIREYPYIGNKDHVPMRIWSEDYDFKHTTYQAMSLEYVCNQFIHSYVCQIVYGNGRDIYGIVVASDRYKGKSGFFLLFNEWLEVLEFCIEHCTV